MILKIGIQNENDSTVIVRTYDNISQMYENEPGEHDQKHKERLIHFIRPTHDNMPEGHLAFNIDWDKRIKFAYLMNDDGKTFKVLKHDQRSWDMDKKGETKSGKEEDMVASIKQNLYDTREFN